LQGRWPTSRAYPAYEAGPGHSRHPAIKS
jgi:hypothetical protein